MYDRVPREFENVFRQMVINFVPPSPMLKDKVRIRNLENNRKHVSNHTNTLFSPEYAFHNSTIEYDILIQQRMPMRMKLVKLREKQE